MSRMGDVHQDLASIHQILLGQRKVAVQGRDKAIQYGNYTDNVQPFNDRIEFIDDLFIEFEAAGVVWPDNVVELHHE